MLPSCACIEASTANNRLAPDSVAVRTQFTIILLGKVCDSSRRDTDSFVEKLAIWTFLR